MLWIALSLPAACTRSPSPSEAAHGAAAPGLPDEGRRQRPRAARSVPAGPASPSAADALPRTVGALPRAGGALPSAVAAPPPAAAALPPAAAAPLPAPTAADWHTLACLAGRYTPRLWLDVPAGVLRLEVAASLRLFGGLAALLDQLHADLRAWPWPLHRALAHTPRAAFWCARAGIAARATDAAQTRAALAAVELAALPLAPDLLSRLRSFGLRDLGQVLALPRAALAARVGSGFVLDLARALGEVEECPAWFVFPERFSEHLELPAPVTAAPTLLFAARRLLAALGAHLDHRHRAVATLNLRLLHAHGAATDLPLHFSAPLHAPERIERVLAPALERLRLAAPVGAMQLHAAQFAPRDARSATLFGSTGNSGDDATHAAFGELLDRLHARLGDAAVQRLACHADHRPERASTCRAAVPGKATFAGMKSPGGTAPPDAHAPLRPLCLVDPPQRIREHAGRPWLNGPLRLLAGPERIESGWWDGTDVRRDYFIARDAQARWLWLFRTCRSPGQWYLQGEFC